MGHFRLSISFLCLTDKTAEDYASKHPTCLNVLHGLNQFKLKSSSGKYKKTDKPVTIQNARRASWNDASFSEILQTNSKAENKFENLFAAAAIANPSDNDIDTDSDASQIEVSVPHHDDPLTARSEKHYSWNEDSDVQNIKANKSTEFPKTAALSSFIANLGVGYESPSRATLASLKSDSSKNNKNNSWFEESIIINSPKVYRIRDDACQSVCMSLINLCDDCFQDHKQIRQLRFIVQNVSRWYLV